MRLLIKLAASKDQAYEPRYHGKMNGFVYDLIGQYDPSLHGRDGYKFFCFSNIFPRYDMKEGDMRNLLISSPNEELIKSVAKNFPFQLNIGDLSFETKEIKIVRPHLNGQAKIKTETPITMRIPKRRFPEYGIDDDRESLFWEPKYSFSAYVKQLEENIYKKYKEFHPSEKDLIEEPIFENYTCLTDPDKVIHITINIKGRDTPHFATNWEYTFTHISSQQRKLLEFALDTGIGERNTYGMGFVNVVRE